MSINTAGHIRWRFRCAEEHKRSTRYIRYSPDTTRYQNVHAKVAHKVGVSRTATVDHGKYLENKDRKSILAGKRDLVGKIGEPIEFAKRIGKEQEHYRIVLAPKRGDLLDIHTLVVNSVRDVESQIGRKIEYAAAIHRPATPNSAGIDNLHAHLIVRGGFGRGAGWFKTRFREAAALEATRQIELGIGGQYRQLELAKEHEMQKQHD